MSTNEVNSIRYPFLTSPHLWKDSVSSSRLGSLFCLRCLCAPHNTDHPPLPSTAVAPYATLRTLADPSGSLLMLVFMGCTAPLSHPGQSPPPHSDELFSGQDGSSSHLCAPPVCSKDHPLLPTASVIPVVEGEMSFCTPPWSYDKDSPLVRFLWASSQVGFILGCLCLSLQTLVWARILLNLLQDNPPTLNR